MKKKELERELERVRNLARWYMERAYDERKRYDGAMQAPVPRTYAEYDLGECVPSADCINAIKKQYILEHIDLFVPHVLVKFKRDDLKDHVGLCVRYCREVLK